MNKYHAKKTFYRGIEYDSKHEAQVAYELDMLERAHKISDLQRQVRFILQDRFTDNQGNTIRPISYIADFCYVKHGQKYAVDAKSSATRKIAVYMVKKKLFLKNYPDYIFLEK